MPALYPNLLAMHLHDNVAIANGIDIDMLLLIVGVTFSLNKQISITVSLQPEKSFASKVIWNKNSLVTPFLNVLSPAF